jgi:uncharacterized RDD family membrane protein YckC
MNDLYFILEDGEQTGPFTFDELVEKEPDIHTRILSPNEDTWKDACDLPELYEYFLAQGLNFPTEDNLASYWTRLFAFVIDLLLIYVVFSIILAILITNGLMPNILAYSNIQALSKVPPKYLFMLQFIFYIIIITYNSICETSAMKGSFGKRIFRLVVVDADGMGISFINAIVRSLGKVVSLYFLGVGFISIFWSEHRQTLHDYLAKTYVVKQD